MVTRLAGCSPPVLPILAELREAAAHLPAVATPFVPLLGALAVADAASILQADRQVALELVHFVATHAPEYVCWSRHYGVFFPRGPTNHRAAPDVC